MPLPRQAPQVYLGKKETKIGSCAVDADTPVLTQDEKCDRFG